jgi:FixJ family two-component response regulator
MTKQNRWTLRRRQIAAMVVAGYPRKNIASKLNI